MDNFSEKEFEKALNKTLAELKMLKIPSKEKRAFLLGGQPGAGKSGMTILLTKEIENENIIVINGDDFRKKHPHFIELQKIYGKEAVEYTKTFAGKMTEALINKLSDEGYNLIIEGTLRTAEIPLKTQQELSKKGYQVEMAVIQVRPEVSYLGTLTRYEEMIKRGLEPRATLKKDHQVVVDNIANNLSKIYNTKLFSNIRIYNRESECLYSMKETPNIDPGTLISKEFQRALSEDEKKQILNGYDKVLKYMNERKASKEEIAIIEKEKANSIKEIENPFEKLLKNRENSLENDKDMSSWEKKLSNDRKALTLGKE